MKQKWIIVLLLVIGPAAMAGHITGGEIYYTYQGFSGGRHQYSVTMKFYKRCNITTSFPNPAVVSVFNKTDNSRFVDVNAPLDRVENIRLNINNPCISNPPLVCFDVAYYIFTVSVPASTDGYVLASQINFRILGMNNLTPGYTGIGATYTAEIPGNQPISSAVQNNSARFIGSDLVLVCTGNSFSYSFRATDPDGDELRYSFCQAYNSTAGGGGVITPDPPPYPSVPYAAPNYSGSQPMGPGISVNTNTGLVQGIAPQAGQYVVTVCVEEIRSGNIIAVQRKDIQINVADCSIAAATLQPEYLLCGSSQFISLTNESGSPAILSTDWEVYDASGTPVTSYSGATLNYNFPDTGIYSVKLVINRGQSCADSTTALVKVFPGFFPDFSFVGGCVNRPTFFMDLTVSGYGIVTSWNWDFGDPSTPLDVSALQNPTYQYPQTGTRIVRLIVTNSKGCRDTVQKNIDITTGPALSLAFRDTLICRNDNLTLQATGSGTYSWSPAIHISDPTSPSPQVFPPVSTTYYVDLNAGGCTNRDSVRVRVVDFVTLIANDTTICSGDLTQLQIRSDGLQFSWMPAAAVSDPFVKNPFVNPATLSAFTVTAVIGGCTETKTLVVTPVPYPIADAGKDTAICYNSAALLQGSSDGSSWIWSPVQYITNPLQLITSAQPPKTTAFVLSAFDTKGCPKPGVDTAIITVLPRLKVNAGNDTAVVTGQPLQLKATGGIRFSWSPPVNLNDPDIADPIAVFNTASAGMQYMVTAFDSAGCSASDWIIIKIFQTGPTVFVPTAFTPNSDGLNDQLRPIGAGIKSIGYFNIYNRWGQLVFSTRHNGRGWDGRVNGIMQPTGTYVWSVSATDYFGKPYFQKGVFTLIR